MVDKLSAPSHYRASQETYKIQPSQHSKLMASTSSCTQLWNLESYLIDSSQHNVSSISSSQERHEVLVDLHVCDRAQTIDCTVKFDNDGKIRVLQSMKTIISSLKASLICHHVVSLELVNLSPPHQPVSTSISTRPLYSHTRLVQRIRSRSGTNLLEVRPREQV